MRSSVSKAVEVSAVFGSEGIIGQVKIPPRDVILRPVPSVTVCAVHVKYSVNGIARDILITAACGKQMGKVKTETSSFTEKAIF